MTLTGPHHPRPPSIQQQEIPGGRVPLLKTNWWEDGVDVCELLRIVVLFFVVAISHCTLDLLCRIQGSLINQSPMKLFPQRFVGRTEANRLVGPKTLKGGWGGVGGKCTGISPRVSPFLLFYLYLYPLCRCIWREASVVGKVKLWWIGTKR
jgi:hypothetical protein